jgi:CNT family concentrative nucleoside transporter
MERIASGVGLLAMMGLAWLLGTRQRHVPLRIVVGGLLLQLLFAVLVLKTQPGLLLFQWLKDGFVALVSCAAVGAEFVFGPDFMQQIPVVRSFAFNALPTIIFFSSLMSVLYYFGVMQWIVRGCAWVMQRTLHTSGSETLAAAANIFVGQTEAPLVIRPYLADMTRSELMAVMVGGFATVAGGVMAAYVGMGIDAGHLLTASVISAPAALLIAKLMLPETQQPQTLGRMTAMPRSEAVNAIHAAAIGAADGLKLALNVAGMLIAFLGLVALLNLLIGLVGSCFGQPHWSLQLLLGYLFAPLAWLLGVPPADCRDVGQLLGIKMVANEFLAYQQLHDWMAREAIPLCADMAALAGRSAGPVPLPAAALPELLWHTTIEPQWHAWCNESLARLSPRSVVLATYALCGFANFGSIGIQIGGIGPLAPQRRSDLAQLGFRAMLGGTLAACMTACVAGILL